MLNGVVVKKIQIEGEEGDFFMDENGNIFSA
jgi:hypothetical protein